MKKNILIILSSNILLSCGTPTVPEQPETGVVYNYTGVNSFNVKKGLLGNKRTKIQTVKLGKLSISSDGTKSILEIPFFKQGKDNTCGQATMASILNFWGIKVDYQTIVNETNSSNIGTDLTVITDYVKKQGLDATAYNNGTIEEIKYLIDQSKPPIVLLDFGSLSKEHYVVVSGYNEDQKTFLINDPVQGANIKVSYTNFEKYWKNESLSKLLIFGDKFKNSFIDISD
jgi:predicted double-glycine peptidase